MKKPMCMDVWDDRTPVLYYLLMVLACFNRQVKTPKPIRRSVLLPAHVDFGAGHECLIFKSEIGFCF
jgi:hypothetical protein